MSYALVGSKGAVSIGASGAAVTPAYGQSPTANNLLILAAANTAALTFGTVPTGWTIAEGPSISGVIIYYKIAAGGDAQPTIAALTSAVIMAQLMEFSGNATTSPVDRVAANTGATGSNVATTAGVDAAAGELLVYSSFAFFSTSATRTLTNAPNNGASANSTDSNATSTANCFSFGHGITTGNSAADSDTFTYPTSKLTRAAVCIASFKLGASAPTLPAPQLRHRAPAFRGTPPSRGRFMVAFPRLWTPRLWLPAGAEA